MTGNNKRRFKTKIGKKNYVLVGEGTEEHMQAVSKLLNEQLEQLTKATPGASNDDRAILLAFNAISNQLDMETQKATQGRSENK
ncbi:cell division protein ZapA [Lentilactobacillus kribbianus]|uniref:cell division protein ZapA n=1 Tax=Lentilactobacillus kribbianus TaxID=2729622 RepID=UPI0015562EA7|nr:cell division protein ZapA [Lentilactobacillus kribbianus]